MKRKLSKNQRGLVRVVAFFLAGLFLITSLTAVWLYRSFYNTEQFTSITTEALLQQSTRDSIGRYVSDEIFADRPIARSVVGPRVASFVSGLLGTDLAGNAITRLTERIQILVTTPQRPPVVIELGSIKELIVQFQNSTIREGEEARIEVDKIPDSITVIDTSKIPNFYEYSSTLLWIAPISFVTGIGILGTWVYRGRRYALRRRLQVVSIVVVLTAVSAMLVGPLFKPSFLALAQNSQSQVIMGNVYDAFLSPFYTQAIVLATIAVIGFVSASLYPAAQKKLRAKKAS